MEKNKEKKLRHKDQGSSLSSVLYWKPPRDTVSQSLIKVIPEPHFYHWAVIIARKVMYW